MPALGPRITELKEKKPKTSVTLSPGQGHIRISDGCEDVIVPIQDLSWKYTAKDNSVKLSFTLGAEVDLRILAPTDPQLPLPWGSEEEDKE